MARITIPPKPGLWAANAAAVDPYWREYWQDLFVFIPYHGDLGDPGQAVAPQGEMASFGWNAGNAIDTGTSPDSNVPYWDDAAADADWVLGPVGPGLKGSLSISVNEGVVVTSTGRQFRVTGQSVPFAMAILFEWDGLDQADQRALISQGTFRVRINPDAEPHAIGGSDDAIANCVWHDELTLLVVWSNPKGNDESNYDTAVFNLDEHPEVHLFGLNTDLLGTADDTDPIMVGGHASNDPSEGLTVYGFWAWGGDPNTPTQQAPYWNREKVEKFAEDPFGMYRKAVELIPPSPIAQVGTIQKGSNNNGQGLTLTFDGMPQEGDLSVVIASIGNEDGLLTEPAGPSTVDYIERGHFNAGSNRLRNIGVWTKVMGSTPDTGVVCQGSGAGEDGVCYMSIMLRGVDIDNPMDAAPVLTETTTPDDPDLDPITTVTDGAWVIAAFGGSPDNSDITAFPTGYIRGDQIVQAETNVGNLAMAVKEVVLAGVEDPDAITAEWGQGHASFLLAFRPTGNSPLTMVGTPQIGNAQDGGDVTLTFDVAPLEDDVVLIFGGHGNNGGAGIAGPEAAASYTEHDKINDGADAWLSGVWSKVMTATPDTDVLCLGGGTSDATVYSAWVIRGVDLTTRMDTAPVVTARVQTDDPDPDPITTVTDDAWVLAVGHVRNDDVPPDGGYPNGYDRTIATGRIDTNRQALAIAKKAVPVAGTQDPSPFSMVGSSALQGAWTVAIRPAGAAAAASVLLRRYRQGVYHQDSSLREDQVFA